MRLLRTEIPEVVLLEPRVFEDACGASFESYNRRTFRELTGLDLEFVQDNRSRSAKNVPQGKLVTALHGEIFDVAVDLRRSSATFGKWVGFRLSGANRLMAWIPPGFGHGFLVLWERADVLYKLTDFWSPEHERTVLWNDPELAISWPLEGRAIISARDANGTSLSRADTFA